MNKYCINTDNPGLLRMTRSALQNWTSCANIDSLSPSSLQLTHTVGEQEVRMSVDNVWWAQPLSTQVFSPTVSSHTVKTGVVWVWARSALACQARSAVSISLSARCWHNRRATVAPPPRPCRNQPAVSITSDRVSCPLLCSLGKVYVTL